MICILRLRVLDCTAQCCTRSLQKVRFGFAVVADLNVTGSGEKTRKLQKYLDILPQLVATSLYQDAFAWLTKLVE